MVVRNNSFIYDHKTNHVLQLSLKGHTEQSGQNGVEEDRESDVDKEIRDVRLGQIIYMEKEEGY